MVTPEVITKVTDTTDTTAITGTMDIMTIIATMDTVATTVTTVGTTMEVITEDTTAAMAVIIIDTKLKSFCVLFRLRIHTEVLFWSRLHIF